MRQATTFDSLTALKEPRSAAASGVITARSRSRDAGRPAMNDTRKDQAIFDDDVGSRRQTRLADTLGNVAAKTAPSTRPTSYDLYHAARARRSLVLGDLVVSMIRSLGSIARRARARYRQRREARELYDALRHLDDHLLRDLGFHRCEIASVAQEVTGATERTRVRVLLMSRSSP